jgi:hypothetical protein
MLVCTVRRSRGAEACANKHGVPADEFTAAVFAQMRQKFLNPAALAALIEQARNAGQREPELLTRERDSLAEDVRRLTRELSRLAEAVAAGGDMPAIVAAIRSKQAAKDNAERRSSELSQRIDAGAEAFDRRQWLIDNRPFFDGLSVHLASEDVPAVRQLLKQLLVSPIVVSPQSRGDAVCFTFTAEASFAGLPATAWATWEVPRTRTRRKNGLYVPAASPGHDGSDDPDDGPAIEDGRQQNHLLNGVLTRRVRKWCPRGDSNTRHAV